MYGGGGSPAEPRPAPVRPGSAGGGGVGGIGHRPALRAAVGRRAEVVAALLAEAGPRPARPPPPPHEPGRPRERGEGEEGGGVGEVEDEDAALAGKLLSPSVTKAREGEVPSVNKVR